MPQYQAPLSPSTEWAWRRVRVSRPAGGHIGHAPKALRWFGLPRVNPREPVRLTIKLRGGPECWVEVHARGRVGRFPGTTCLYDMLTQITSGNR